ncbi:TPA: hypothetical protein ACGO2N_000800 [Streptococcus suis]
MYKVITLNAHLQGGTQFFNGEWNREKNNGKIKWEVSISNTIIDDIISENPDILILTEFWKFTGYEGFIKELLSNNYFVECNTQNREYGKNQILIAFKNNFQKVEVVDNLDSQFSPDFLHVKVQIENTNLNILGIRIRQSNFKFSNKYKYRQKQIEAFHAYCEKLSGPLLIGGDFNHGKICGDEKLKYSDVQKMYDTLGTSLLKDTYNFHILKDLFNQSYKLHTPSGNQFSWYDSVGNGYKLEHFITKNCHISNIQYKKGNSYLVDRKGYPAPDHKMCIGYLNF